MRNLSAAFAAVALAGAASLVAAPAAACSPAPGATVPTNLELAADANVIIIGKVTGATPGAQGDEFLSTITIRPVAAVKGLMPSEDIRVSGMVLAPAGEVEQSDLREFSEAHPDSFTGGCIRRVFSQGTQALFFLSRENGEWQPAGGLFSRWAEDVSGMDSPWVALAGLYAHAALMEPEQRTAMLEEQREALLVRSDDGTAQLMADDIARQLAGPNPPLRQHLPPAPPILLPENADDAAPGDQRAETGEAVLPTDEAPAGIDDVEAALDAMGSARP